MCMISVSNEQNEVFGTDKFTHIAFLYAGLQGQPPAAPASAPLTRQPSSFLPPTSPSSTPHGCLSRFPSGANRGAEAAHQRLPGPLKGNKGSSPSGSPLQLPRLQACPSVASAPCTSGLTPTRRHPGGHACNSVINMIAVLC